MTIKQITYLLESVECSKQKRGQNNKDMSKKHFQDFAKEIHGRVMNGAPTLEIELAIDIICQVAKRHNPMFNRERFRSACYGK